jgi:tRNA/tmRNA/rRNA uracil-C5-methylase (TrmA/RlmC/RlmD family)
VPQVVSGAGTGFRLRARLAIRGRVGAPKLGLFELGTHRVVHIPHCAVQHPLVNRVAGVVRRAIAETRLTCYSDQAQLGLLRYLQVVVERSSQTAQVVLVANDPSPAPLAACLELVRERLGADLHSLWSNANTAHGNTILGPGFHCWQGPPSVVEHFGGAAVHYPPGAFGQNNLDLAARLVARLADWVPPGSRVAEFYAGVGAIGLSLLGRVRAMSLNEAAPQSLLGLEMGLAALEPGERAKVVVVPGDAGEMHACASGADLVIADPPRKGLDPGLLAALLREPPSRFIYVSCGLESFLADTARLTAGGRLRLAELEVFNLLPYTAHVETVARFERL